MENKIFHLSTCNTCQRIIGELDTTDGITLQNIKEKHITEAELDYVKDKVGSYEALFNKRAQKYRAQGLNNQSLSEQDWKQHILAEYTFLKRPLAVYNEEVYPGNAKKTVEALKSAVNG